jgi:hypothetical protein
MPSGPSGTAAVARQSAGTLALKVIQPPPGDLIRQPLLSAPALPA